MQRCIENMQRCVLVLDEPMRKMQRWIETMERWMSGMDGRVKTMQRSIEKIRHLIEMMEASSAGVSLLLLCEKRAPQAGLASSTRRG
jgi:hypothetical protein